MARRKTLNPPGIAVPNSEGVVTATAAATNYLLHDVPAGRTARLRKVRWFNRGATNVRLIIGDTDTGGAGGAFTARMVSIDTIAGRGGELGEDVLEEHEFNAASNVFAQISGANTGVDIRCEFEETGG